MPRELVAMQGKYTQFEGTEIVAENCVKARVKDLVIEGKTYIADVPNDYTILDYIESTGTQYIDTGFKANTTTTKFIGAFTPTEKVMGALLGSRNATSSGTHACNVFVTKDKDGVFRFDWADGSYTLTVGYNVGEKYEIEITRGTVIVNGTEYSVLVTSSSYDQLGNFLIGNFNNGTTPYSSGFVGRIHECKLYSNDVLVRDFIPAKRNSDDVVGMYDVVTEKFYTNAGTGIFVAGESVSSSLSNYIKSVAEDEENVLSIKVNDNVTNINLPIPLRSLPNGVADTIEGDKLVQRVGKVVINGENGSYLRSGTSTSALNIYVVRNLGINLTLGKLSANYIYQSDSDIDMSKYITVGKWMSDTTSGSVVFKVPTEEYSWTDIRNAFLENPITLYVELAEPIIHSLEIPQLSTARGTNIITTENNIKPKLSMKVKVKK